VKTSQSDRGGESQDQDAAGTPSIPRTAAQAEASRRNGKLSKGPKTADGKARSATNALRHGILARSITPLPNEEMEDRDYEHYYQELVREFTPQTITEFNAVELLAFDYVRLARLAQFQDLPGRPMPHYAKQRVSVADAEERVDMADALIAYFGGGPQVGLPAHKLKLVSNNLIEYVSHVVERADQALQRLKLDQKLGADQQAELDLAERTDPESLIEGKQDAVSKRLSGATPSTPSEAQRWLLLLAQWRLLLIHQLEREKYGNTEGARELRQHRENGAPDLAKMGALQRYDGQLRRAISKQIAFLERRRRAQR
jgi:hypothetical protein